MSFHVNNENASREEILELARKTTDLDDLYLRKNILIEHALTLLHIHGEDEFVQMFYKATLR